jgi:lactate dehydrogenase-like 2-hydroxyacid dehydrogenase
MADLQVTIASDDASFDTAMAEALDVGRLDGRVTDVAVPEPWSADDRLWRTRGMFVPLHMSSDDLATYNDNSLDILLPVLDRRGQGRVGSTRCSWIVVTERKSHAALLRKCHG